MPTRPHANYTDAPAMCISPLPHILLWAVDRNWPAPCLETSGHPLSAFALAPEANAGLADPSFFLQLLWEVEAYAKAAGVPRASLMSSSSSSGASVSLSAGPLGLQPCAPNIARDPGERSQFRRDLAHQPQKHLTG